MDIKICLLLLLPVLLLLPGCVTPEEQSVMNVPKVQEFLAEHPDATIKVSLVVRSLFTQQQVEIFKSKCGKELGNESFYYALITGDDKIMEVWLTEDFDVLCISKSGIAPVLQCNNDMECNDSNSETFDECVLGFCEYRAKTCKEKNGRICPKGWYCSTGFIRAYDTDRCCMEQCAETKCEFVECESNEKCIDGNCVLMKCKELRGIECPQMLKCDAATTIASDTNKCCITECEQINPCSELRCPEGTRCRDGTCVSE